MAKEIDKIIQSKTAPKSNNVLWDDGENLKINRNGKWENTGTPMINITYANLVELRNNNKLIAGSYYRIIDYITTTVQENTKSAGHPFDVIVLALSENTLAEEAYAIHSARDTNGYFANSNLAAWQIWYSLNNDAERFAWADVKNGKGIIYRMIDEWNNDIPYDFKNIIYVETPTFECSQYGVAHTYTKNGNVINIDSVKYYGYTRTRTGQGPPPPPEVLYITDEMPTTNSIIYTIEGSVATPYTSATIDSVNQKSGDYYTFHANGKEASVHKIHKCDNNIISVSYQTSRGLHHLNKIVFVEQFGSKFSCYGNSLGNNCYNNIFGNNCYNNIFGNNCYNNILNDNCHSNIFGNYCYSNTLGYCYNNTFGNDCCENTFGNNCYSNSLGNNCHSNSLGNNCDSNSFGNDCSSNSLGNGCGSLELNESTSNKTVSVNSRGEAKVFNLADLADLLNQ